MAIHVAVMDLAVLAETETVEMEEAAEQDQLQQHIRLMILQLKPLVVVALEDIAEARPMVVVAGAGEMALGQMAHRQVAVEVALQDIPVLEAIPPIPVKAETVVFM